MTEVADTAKQVGQGLTQNTYSYEALDALIDIVTNTAGKSKISLLPFLAVINVLYRTSCSGHRPEVFFWRKRNIHVIGNRNIHWYSIA